MFQALHLFANLPAVTNPLPGAPSAKDAIHAATIGGARALGLWAGWRIAARNESRPRFDRHHRAVIRATQ
jgi:cytosine/adenosine deaminase-related metal-dependent hydrolase